MSEWIETEIIPRVPKEWSRHVLEELGEFKNGVNFSASDFGKGFPVVNVKQLFNKRYIEFGGLEEIKPQTLSKPDSYKLIKGDILIARSSVKLEGTGQVAVIGDELEDIIVFSGFIIRYRSSSNKLNPFFLNYLLRSKFYKEHFINIAAGTSIVNLSQDTLKAIPVFLPSLPEQQAIAEVLSSLDDKIDLLHRNNKTLEEMAETLFRQWFVEGAKEDWEVVQIGDLCIRITKGTTPTTMGKKFYDSGINFIKAESIEDHGSFNKSKFAFIDQETHEMLSRSQLKAGDVLYTIAGTIGRTCIVTESILPANTNQAVAILKNDTNKISSLFLKYLMKSDIIKEVLDSKVVHAVQPNLSLGEISSTSLSLPPKTLLDRFDLIVQSIADKINSNSNQLEHLINTRDTLLPKLMSGLVKVNLNA